MGRFRANRYRVAVVAEGDLRMAQATSVFLFREGHSCYGQHGYPLTMAATTLRIDTLRLIRILLPCVGGLYLYVWLATLQVRGFLPVPG